MATRTADAGQVDRQARPATAGQAEPNPLREGLRLERMAEPCTMVICGATGDLTERKLGPALYNTLLGGFLPPEFTVVGFARRDLSDEQFRDHLLEGINEHSRNKPAKPAIWESFARGIEYHRGDFDDPAAYVELSKRLDRIDRDRGTAGNRLFYLAVPPSLYPEIVNQLDRAGLAARGDRRTSGSKRGWTRVIVEKPFGYDLDSARTLNHELAEVFDEEQVYRIDHYLGKETVQNLSVFRFGNGLFEPIWNRRYIDSVQITVAETVGVEGRGDFYDETGALRDIVQNHGLQLLAMFAMEPPVEFSAQDLRNEKLKVLRAVKPMAPEDVAANTVRGQYVSGWVEGERVSSYRDEPEVAPDSETETYAARRSRSSSVPASPRSIRTSSPSVSSPTRGSSSASVPRSRDKASRSGRSTWTFATDPRSRSIRPMRTRRSCWTRWWVTPASS